MQTDQINILFHFQPCPVATLIQNSLAGSHVRLTSVSSITDLRDELENSAFDLFICLPRQDYTKVALEIGDIIQKYKSLITLLVYLEEKPGKTQCDFCIGESDLMNERILTNYLTNILSYVIKQKTQMTLSTMLLHDLRSPMQSILGYLELLEKEVFGEVNVGQRQILLNAIALSDTIVELLDELSQVYLYEQKQFEIIRTPVHLRELIEETLRSLWIQADRKNIKFVPQLPPNLPDINVDANGIRRVLTNLLTNAIKFSTENGTVRIFVQPGESTMQRPQVKFLISDTGPGIPAEHLDAIFNKYFRLQDHKRTQKGQGLGLYISRLIVEAHDGQIGVYNNREGGSTFYFTLPMDSRAEKTTQG